MFSRFGSIHGSPTKVLTEEIMLIGATNASRTSGGNTPIKQGSLKSPAPINSVTRCELLTNGTLATMSNRTLSNWSIEMIFP